MGFFHETRAFGSPSGLNALHPTNSKTMTTLNRMKTWLFCLPAALAVATAGLTSPASAQEVPVPVTAEVVAAPESAAAPAGPPSSPVPAVN